MRAQQPEARTQNPRPPLRTTVARGLFRAFKLVADGVVYVVSGPGLGATGEIDDSALPSGFEAPYRRGSRQIRSLFHAFF
jgi:hypothetical protein